MSILNYEFMRSALIIGILLAIVLPCLGQVIVIRHLSMIGDSLSHMALGGVAAGLVAGINPVAGALIFTILGAFSIEWIRKRIPQFSEVSIAIIMTTGVGIAGVLSGSISGAASLTSFLFGSIVAISKFEFYLVVILALSILVFVASMWRELKFIAFDERLAKLAGVPVDVVNIIFTFMVAVAVGIASRTVGALIVSAVLVIPIVAALQLSHGYTKNLFIAIIISVFASVLALVLSFYFGVKPGGTTALILVAILLLSFALSTLKNRFKKPEQAAEEAHCYQCEHEED